MNISARQSEHIVEAEVKFIAKGSNDFTKIRIGGIKCTWLWDESSRDAAEYWAVSDYIHTHFDYDWFTILNWTSTAVEKENDND